MKKGISGHSRLGNTVFHTSVRESQCTLSSGRALRSSGTDQHEYLCLTSISQTSFKSELFFFSLLNLLAFLVTLNDIVLEMFLGKSLSAVILEEVLQEKIMWKCGYQL